MAAIDIGSNSLRLIIAALHEDGSYEVLDDEKIVTRLGRGTSVSHRLDADAIEVAAAAVRTMRQIADGHGVDEIRAVATCAVREASNRQDFVDAVREQAGLEVEVISGEREADLAYASVTGAFDIGGRELAVVDIGGGSTEISLCSDGLVGQVASMSVGAVRLTEAASGKPERRLRRMARIVRDHVREHLGRPPIAPAMMIGTGGTFTTMAAMHQLRRGGPNEGGDRAATPIRGARLHRADVRRLLETLNRMGVRERADLPGLNPDRAEIIVAGIAIADTIMDRLGINELMVHDGGVRDGLLLEMAGGRTQPGERHRRGPADRIAAARDLAHRCNRDVDHSRQVERLALRLYDQLATEPEIANGRAALSNIACRELLQIAAILHDIGYYISYRRHHKHSWHLIIHSRLPGLRSDELATVAAIARYHRRAAPRLKHAEFRRLEADQRTIVRELSSILRLAVGFDRAHAACVQDVHLTVDDGTVTFQAIADERPDADLWGAERKSVLFEKVFGVRCAFTWRHPRPSEHST
ncbi:MAG: HD domain-containing protein [Phycisphaerales bacterium]